LLTHQAPGPSDARDRRCLARLPEARGGRSSWSGRWCPGGNANPRHTAHRTPHTAHRPWPPAAVPPAPSSRRPPAVALAVLDPGGNWWAAA